VINAISNRISAVVAGAASATSAEVSALGQAVSLQAASALSAALPTTKIVTGSQVISASALTFVSGLTAIVSAGGLYKMECFLFIDKLAGGTPMKFGLTFPTMTRIRGKIYAPVSIAGPAVTTTPLSVAVAVGYHVPFEGNSASGSVIVTTQSAALLSTFATYNAVMLVDTTGSIRILAAGAATTSAIAIQPGSYLQVFKVA
jgi:hypothetical protein